MAFSLSEEVRYLQRISLVLREVKPFKKLRKKREQDFADTEWSFLLKTKKYMYC
jgi:hypothetical protein